MNRQMLRDILWDMYQNPQITEREDAFECRHIYVAGAKDAFYKIVPFLEHFDMWHEWEVTDYGDTDQIVRDFTFGSFNEDLILQLENEVKHLRDEHLISDYWVDKFMEAVNYIKARMQIE